LCKHHHYLDLEADILCEAARQAEKANISEELLLMALSLCPLHPCSLIALADLELKKIELNPIKNLDYGNFIKNENIELNHSNIEDFYGGINADKKLKGKGLQDTIIVYDDIKAYQYAITAVKGSVQIYDMINVHVYRDICEYIFCIFLYTYMYISAYICSYRNTCKYIYTFTYIFFWIHVGTSLILYVCTYG
jgi:hypothetical protein